MNNELEIRARELLATVSDPDQVNMMPAVRRLVVNGLTSIIDGIATQQPSAVDADSVVATLCHSHKKFAEWWDDLGERRALLFMRALTDAMLAAAPKPEVGK